MQWVFVGLAVASTPACRLWSRRLGLSRLRGLPLRSKFFGRQSAVQRTSWATYHGQGGVGFLTEVCQGEGLYHMLEKARVRS